MAATANTATSLSESYFLRTFYRSNRDAATTNKRSEIANSNLSKADSTALRAAIRNLRSFRLKDDSDEDISEDVCNSVSAFLKTYNNAMDSANATGNSSLKRYAKQLKNLAKEYADELEDIGITVNSDGTLAKNDNLLKSASQANIKKLFAEDADFAVKSVNYAKHINTKATDLIYTELTKKGQTINLTL